MPRAESPTPHLVWRTTMPDIPAIVHDMIARSIEQALPEEAVGLLWAPPGKPVRVITLPNQSATPEVAYEISGAELLHRFLEQFEQWPDDPSEITLWHSHPSGQTGPSRGDMRTKIGDLVYMVIAVTPDGLVPQLF